MPITYAGIPLTPTTEAAHAAAAAYWHGHRLDQWEYQGYTRPNIQHLPTPFWPQREPPRIGVLHWPVGADRFALCQLAITGTQRTQLLRAVGSAPTAQPLVFSDGTTSITAQMYVVGLTPISQRGDSKEYYLLTLTDERYFWWQSGAAETPSSFTSWADLLGQLFTAVGVTATVETVPSAYLTPTNARWNLGVEPIPMVIEAAARTIGMRVVRALSGAVTVQRPASSLSADTLRWEQIRYLVLAGGQVQAGDVALGLPASCTTQFFDGSSNSVTLASLSLTSVSGVSGRSGLVTADASGPSSSEKAAYAAQAAQDYYQWAFAPTDATIRGFSDIEPCGFDEAVEWVHTDTSMVTRVLRAPWADRNVYGNLAFGQGTGSGGSGSGSGSGNQPWEPCDAAVNPVSVSCTTGRRVLTSTALGLARDGSTLVLTECSQTTADLGACSPDNPDGTAILVVEKVCPGYGECVTVTTASSPYTLTSADTKVVVDASGGPVNLYLPPWTVSDEWFTIIVSDDTNTITAYADTTLPDSVNGAASVELTGQWSIWTAEALCVAGAWAIAAGSPSVTSGTVTSVAMAVPSGYSVAGSPITTSGTLAVTLSDAAAARTGLGLGTAAVKDTGTSGSTVPLLDGANTWSGTAAFSSSLTVTGHALFHTSVVSLVPRFGLYDAGNDHILFIAVADQSVTRTLTIDPEDGDRTLTLGGNLTVPSNATVSGTNTGDQTSVTGNAGTATALQTARTIGGVSFDGTANIVPQTIESASETTDTTCFPLFITASGTQQLQPKNNTSFTFDASTAALGITTIELGHASDTTLARSSAGNVSIEGNVIYRAGGTDVALADGGTNANLSGTGPGVLQQTSAGANVTVGQALDYILVRDEKTSGTNGGTFTSGAWRTRDLNTEVTDTGGNCSLASNQITLSAGTYRIRASAPAFGVDRHQARLQNVTAGTTLVLGTSEQSATVGSQATTRSIVQGRFTVAASQALELQHQCSATGTTTGFGLSNSFGTQVYAVVEITKEVG